MSQQYGKLGFWEDFYTLHFAIKFTKEKLDKRKDYFDWYQTFKGVEDVITDHCLYESKILNVGCGNSSIHI